MAIKRHHIDAMIRAVLAPEALAEWRRRNQRVYVQSERGEFIEVHHLSTVKPKRIVCEPIPGRHGIDYVQDWCEITHFG